MNLTHVVKSSLAIAALVSAAATPQASAALAPASARVDATPANAGSAAVYAFEISASEPRGAYPAGLLVSLPAGLRLDGRAVPRRCSHRAARAHACPRASRIAVGSAELLQTATFFPSDPGVPLTVAIGVYAAPTRRPADLGRLQVISREGVTSIAGAATGTISSASAGAEPHLSLGLGLVQRAPEETITFTGLNLSLGGRHGRFSLVRNPRLCGGWWPVGIALTGVERVSASVPCAG